MEKHRAKFISSILRFCIVINILLFVISAAMMFITADAPDVYILGITGCTCLVASVGFQLLSRWQRLGFYVVIGIYLCASVILHLFFGDELSSFIPGSESGELLPFAATGFVLILLLILLFVIRSGKERKNCWSQMSNGADTKHFRHIYQLTTVLLLITGGLTFYLASTKSDNLQDIASAEPKTVKREISYQLLDSANVTLDEVIAIENMMDSIPSDLQPVYKKRVFALKHLLLSGLMATEHDPNDIINIIKIHPGQFSESQQHILDWYLGLPGEIQKEWIYSPPVTNLQEFKLLFRNYPDSIK